MILTSLEKHLLLIETLAAHPRGLTLSQLHELTGQPISSMHHALSTFRKYDFVMQSSETKKYSLGLKFLSISRSLLDTLDLRNIAKKALQALNAETEEMVLLAVLRQGKAVYLTKIQTAYRLCQDIDVGYTSTAHTSTIGKALLSGLSKEELLSLFPHEELPPAQDNQENLPPLKERLITTRTELLQELETIRRRGYFYGEALYYQGVRAISAPIFMGKKLAAAVCLTGSSFTMTEDRIKDFLIPRVLQCAREITTLLTK